MSHAKAKGGGGRDRKESGSAHWTGHIQVRVCFFRGRGRHQETKRSAQQFSPRRDGNKQPRAKKKQT